MTSFNSKGKQTYNVSEIQVGDIVKFKGTRNKGYRKVIEINSFWQYNYLLEKQIQIVYYFNKVLNMKMSGFSEQPYTSTNSVDKLSHVYKEGNWYKVIKD